MTYFTPRSLSMSADQAAEVCTAIRATIRNLYGARVARSITIQYGGSMNPKNAAELLAQWDIDKGDTDNDLAPLGPGEEGLEFFGKFFGFGGGRPAGEERSVRRSP